MQFRYDIQGLRTLAVSFVLIFHINKDWLPGGFIGVDMFFVISGYLISSIILNRKKKEIFSFKDFYLSRIKRIVPAYLVFLIITTILVSFIFLTSDANKYRVALLWASIFNSNNYFATLDTYFGAASSEQPLLHTWTLAIEMQFYLFLPFIIIFFSFKNSKWILILLTIALTIYATYNISIGNKDAMYFSLLARSPEFFLGVLINYFRFDFINKKYLVNSLSAAGFILLIFSLFTIEESSPFPGLTALVPCIGTCLILISKESYLNNFISSKPFVFFGELSYSIYLWHWPILALYRYYVGQYIIDNYFHLGIIIIIVLVLSWLSYRYIENAFRHKGLDKKFVISFSLLIVLLGVSAFSVKIINSRFSRYPIAFTSPVAHGLNSHGSTYKFDEIRGDTLSTDTLLLLGDSRALTMKTYLELLGKRNNFSFRSVTNDRIPPIPNIAAEDISLMYYSRYEKLAEIAAKHLERSKIIILARAWHIQIPSFYRSLDELCRNLKENQHLILLSDYPALNANPLKVNRGVLKKDNSTFQWKVSVNPPPTPVLDLTQKYSNVHFLDLSRNEVFNDVPFYRDSVMYYDEGHINKFGSEKYALSTEEEFMMLLNKLLEKY